MSNDRRQSGLWSRNPETGFYEQAPIPAAHIQPKGPYAYYEPPPRQPYLPQSQRFSFAERTEQLNGDGPLIPTANGVAGANSGKEQGIAPIVQPPEELLKTHPESTSEQLSATKHINSVATSAPDKRAPLSVDPEYVPSNIRAKAWSPDVLSPKELSRNISNASSNRPDGLRKASVPGQSPLQNLENWSKEEKRARVEQAEHLARQRSVKRDDDLRRSATLRSERGRVVSDGVTRQSSQSTKGNEKRQVSGPASPSAMNAAERFQNASAALRETRRQDQPPPRQQDSRSSAVPEPRTSRASDPVNTAQQDENIAQKPTEITRTSAELGRSQSGKYKHRARDAGFAGAAAAYSAGPPISATGGSAERGQAAYERRKASMLNSDENTVSPISQRADQAGLGIDGSGSKRLQKRSPMSGDYGGRDQLQSDRMAPMSTTRDLQVASSHQQPDPVQPSQVQNPQGAGVKYFAPPQTAAGQQASQQVSFSPDVDSIEKHHRLGEMFHRRQHRVYQPSSKPLEDWRQAKTARLTLKDLALEQAFASSASSKDDSAWWEKGRRRSSAATKAVPDLSQPDGPYEEQAQKFDPFLFLKCGPLLRYTGIKKEAALEVWRGSLMIVTDDNQSDLSRTPVLRLFAQPMDLVERVPLHSPQSGEHLSYEQEDPISGQMKLSRTGRPVYVRPLHDIDGETDLSRQENNNGLFSATKGSTNSMPLGSGVGERLSQPTTSHASSRVRRRDGERVGRYQEVKAARLHTERGFTFWRFNIEVELGQSQARVAYRINNGPAIGFWVPAKGETMNIMFHSCNGFSMSVDSNKFSGPDPLWRDVLNKHQSRPFHVMIGGGDQIYNDAAMRDTVLFKEWLASRNPEHKHSADFSPELQDELEAFYLNRYAMWFSQGFFGMANGQIPMINIWDDHDIIDGYGSYPHHFMSTRVFTGLGAVAYKYYMLFQHQSLSTETEKEEPSWLLGKSPGPYIHELSRSVYLSLGNRVTFLGLDCRTERMKDEIMSAETYNNVFDRCQDEIQKGETKHLIVLLGVPIAYPRLNFLENVLTSRAMTPIKALGRTGMLGGFVNKFDGGVEILDDLDDHWTAKHHKGERNWFIQELQELAAEKSVRVTILGGDVHLGAVGQFYSAKKLGIAKDRDHRYMPNIISSAIVNTPPPNTMADVLNRRNKVHHLDNETDEDMIPMFSHDVDGSKRNNTHLLPRRNFCIIREYVPGATPPSTPVRERIDPGTPMSATYSDAQDDQASKDRRFPPGSMKRTMSLTRGPMNLVRRLSGSSKSRNPPVSLAPEHARPYNEADRPLPQRSTSLNAGHQEGYFPAGATMERPVFAFHRRPTNMSEKEAKRAAASGTITDGREPGHVDLEGGLDITLCMEVDQRDPSGSTVPYRLLIPALWYEGAGDHNTAKLKGRRGSIMDKLRFNRKRETRGDGEHADDWSGSDRSRTPSPSRTSQDQVTEQNTAANALGLTSTGRGAWNQTAHYDNPGFTNTGLRDATPRAPRPTENGRNISAPVAASQPMVDEPRNAYHQGYNLSSPPIGDKNSYQGQPQSTQRPPHSQFANNNPYPQSGFRGTSAPNAVQSHGQTQASTAPSRGIHQNGYHDYGSDGSIAQSDDYSDVEDYSRQQPPVRRGSKVERFFGIGDGAGRRSLQAERPQGQYHEDAVRYSVDATRPTQADLGRGGSVKRPANWKIWKKDWYAQRGEQ